MTEIIKINFGEEHKCDLSDFYVWSNYCNKHIPIMEMFDDFYCPCCGKLIIIAEHG